MAALKVINFQQRVSEWEEGHWEWRQPPTGAGAT